MKADVAQLEPRVLAAMSKDRAMANAARGQILYEGVARAVATRDEAKYAVLGAMYGATTGRAATAAAANGVLGLWHWSTRRHGSESRRVVSTCSAAGLPAGRTVAGDNRSPAIGAEG